MTSSSTGPPLILSPEVFRARFAILRKHHERNGHCRGVKNGRITDFTSMVRSGTVQRNALESIEFDFETHRQKAEWLATFYKLSHLLRMGHTIDDTMKQWIHTQRVRHLHNKLPKARVALLNNIHFDWSIPHMQQDVVEEPRRNSDNTDTFLGTTPCHSGSPTGATTSLPAQSPFGAAHVIPREKRTTWDSYFQALRTNIAADLVDADLRSWIREQQANYHSLTEYRRERLKEIGLASDHEDKLQRKRTKGMNQRTLYWDDMWEDLKACRDHHGNDWLSTVPEELGKWLRRQRLLLDSDQLSADRQAKLASIGIVPQDVEGVSVMATKKSHDPPAMIAPKQGIRRVSLY